MSLRSLSSDVDVPDAEPLSIESVDQDIFRGFNPHLGISNTVTELQTQIKTKIKALNEQINIMNNELTESIDSFTVEDKQAARQVFVSYGESITSLRSMYVHYMLLNEAVKDVSNVVGQGDVKHSQDWSDYLTQQIRVVQSSGATQEKIVSDRNQCVTFLAEIWRSKFGNPVPKLNFSGVDSSSSSSSSSSSGVAVKAEPDVDEDDDASVFSSAATVVYGNQATSSRVSRGEANLRIQRADSASSHSTEVVKHRT